MHIYHIGVSPMVIHIACLPFVAFPNGIYHIVVFVYIKYTKIENDVNIYGEYDVHPNKNCKLVSWQTQTQ